MAKLAKNSFSHFPRIFGIVYGLKNDSVSDKHILSLLAQNKEFAALRVALRPYSRIHKYGALLLYLLKTQLNWVPSLTFTLKIFWLLGPSRSWFTYLLKSGNRDTLLTAKHLLQQQAPLKGVTVDVGCGLGHLPTQFLPQKNHSWIAVDKNFFSLFLAQLYHQRKDITYICADVEVERLFAKSSIEKVVCLDCFAWIYQKQVFLEQVAEILKPAGVFLMINVHEESEQTLTWGYGIDRQQLETDLKKNFQKIHWYDHRFPTHDHQSISDLDSLGYSCSAQKKHAHTRS